MSEERIIALEVSHDQLQKDITGLVAKQTEMYKQQIHLDKTMSSILVKLEARFDEEANLDKTLRNLDDSVKVLGLKLEGMPVEHNRTVMLATDRIWDSLRKQDSKLQDFKHDAHKEHNDIRTNIKEEMLNSVKTYGSGIVLVLGVCGLLVASIYYDIQRHVELNSKNISQHHANHHIRGK